MRREGAHYGCAQGVHAAAWRVYRLGCDERKKNLGSDDAPRRRETGCFIRDNAVDQLNSHDKSRAILLRKAAARPTGFVTAAILILTWLLDQEPRRNSAIASTTTRRYPI